MEKNNFCKKLFGADFDFEKWEKPVLVGLQKSGLSHRETTSKSSFREKKKNSVAEISKNPFFFFFFRKFVLFLKVCSLCWKTHFWFSGMPQYNMRLNKWNKKKSYLSNF